MRVVRHSEQIVVHENLTRSARSGANSNCGDLERLCDRRADLGRNALDDNCKRARFLCIRAEILRKGVSAR